MFEVKGKYTTAKIFTDVVDNKAIAQVIQLCNQPYAEGSKIRLMPDVHAGVGCTVGTTMTIADKVCPNLVGVDLSCGMEVIQVKEKDIDYAKLDSVIRNDIPSGYSLRTPGHKNTKQVPLDELYCNVDKNRAACSIGTLGGGNHFIEVDRDDDGNVYIVIHSGSRHLGVEIAHRYQEAAYKYLTEYSRDEINAVIAQMKAEGRQKEIQSTLKSMTPKKNSIPKELAFLEGSLMEQYLHDAGIAQKFADVNRKTMMQIIVDGLGLHVVDQFTTVHNYIDLDAMILRKGAVSAQAGERLIIPMNMRDGSLICVGKGNADWNCSAPHGAGRLMSRSEAKERCSMSEYQKQMAGIYSTCINTDTLDESPMAYKPMDSILENIKPTADVEKVIRPIYNFKASDQRCELKNMEVNE